MVSQLESAILDLEKLGVFDVALPFILVFALVYGVLQKIQIFGSSAKNINVVFALVVAFLVVRVQEVVDVMNAFLPKVSLILLIIIVILLLIGIFGVKPAESMPSGIILVMFLLVLAGVIWALVSGTSKFGLTIPRWLQLSSVDAKILIAVVVVLILIVFMTSGSGSGSGWDKFWTGFKEVIKK